MCIFHIPADETIRMELAYAFRNLMSLNPYQEEQIRQDFRQALGDDLAYEIFEEGEKITEEELRKKQHVQKDLDFSRREKGAWKHVVSDAKRDRDMTDHNKSILKRITIDASKIYALPPEEFEAEKAMLVMSYGPETAQRILDGIHVVHNEVKSKGRISATKTYHQTNRKEN
ncbi:Hypp1570 [Branchiostoma lanceolatum]|uniref:Hypp1570 protein n=1 Tax=Branchiostoma lanceolatum TaxID=7740 RepID=A0A8J9ZL67_BRALA|nr:Hypp1570 [Branchiostoma lanceolatum]